MQNVENKQYTNLFLLRTKNKGRKTYYRCEIDHLRTLLRF